MPGSKNTQITIALIGAAALIIAAVLGILPSFWKDGPPPGDASPLRVTVAVLDSEGSGIEGAKASFAIGPFVQVSRTDSLGRHTFEAPRDLKGRVATINVSGEKFVPQKVEFMLSQPEETREFHLVARKTSQLPPVVEPKKSEIKQACPTEEERKCEGVVVTSHATGWTRLGSCDIDVRTRERKEPGSVFFVEIKADDHNFPRCEGLPPEFFGLQDKCPFEFKGKKWYASLDTVRPQGSKLEAVIRLQRDCRYP